MSHWVSIVIVVAVFLPLGLLSVVAAMRSSQCTGILEAPPGKSDRNPAETVQPVERLRRSA